MTELKKRINNFIGIITSELAFVCYVCITLTVIPLAEFFSQHQEHSFVTQPVLLEAAGVIGLFMAVSDILKRKEDKLFLSDIFFLMLIVFTALSCATAKECELPRNNEAWYNYSEWFFHFMAYFSLMYSGTRISEEKNRKLVLKAIFIAALLHTSAALGQAFGHGLTFEPFFMDPDKSSTWCYGLTQHSNWYGGLSSLFCAGLSGVFLLSRDKINTVSAYIFAMASFFTLVSSNARLALVGAVAFIMFYLISILIMRKKQPDSDEFVKNIKRFAVLIIGFAVVFAVAAIFFDRMIFKIEQTGNELGGDVEGMGSARGYLWRYAIEAVPDNWAFGVGMDNFHYVYESNPRFTVGDWYNDKAHNEYLHYLVTQGVFQFINYISMLVYAVVVSVRNIIAEKDKSKRNLNWIFLGMFTAYAAQAMFNSSVINVAIFFWATIGMCMPNKIQRPLPNQKMPEKALEKENVK